ncbi:PP2C-like domain-containing protein CG9801 [Trichonephila clavipes]|nr:PP2C-like domain-containing protein CG9801 [Trichonephila clavipes]
MMPTFREKVGGFLRQLSTGQEKKTNYKSPCTSPTSTGSFIHKYLLGEVKKYHPEVLYGKSYYDLPVREIAPLSGKVLSACTGPQGGLTTVDLDAKPFEFPDADVHFIDEDHRDSSENLVKFKGLTKDERQSSHHDDIEPWPDVEQNKQQKTEEIAGIKDWFSPCESAYGIATTLYECHPVTKENAGNPIADAFAVVMRENSALLVLADGVNWGEKSCLAARCAIHGCVNYLNKVLYREGAGDITTLSAFLPPASSRDPQKPVLRMSFLDESIRNVGEQDSRKPFSPTPSGSNTIRHRGEDGGRSGQTKTRQNWNEKENGDYKTELAAGTSVELKQEPALITDPNSDDIFISLLRSFSEAHNLILQENGTLTTLCAVVVAQLKKSSKFIACACNVGDSLAYIYSPKYGVREITQAHSKISSASKKKTC